MIADEQMYSHKHSSTHTSVMINVNSSMLAWRVRTNEVHSRVTFKLQVWASARTNEVCSHVSSRFYWDSVCVCWSKFICE